MTLRSVPAGREHQGSLDASVMTAAGLGGRWGLSGASRRSVPGGPRGQGPLTWFGSMGRKGPGERVWRQGEWNLEHGGYTCLMSSRNIQESDVIGG